MKAPRPLPVKQQIAGDRAERSAGQTYDVLLQGNPYCDLTFTFGAQEGMPALGHEVFADGFALNPGGIFTVAAALTRLDLHVGLLAELGNDIFSQYIADSMQDCGMPLDLISRADRPLPVVTAGVSFPRDRLFISYSAPRDPATERRFTVEDLDRYRPRAFFSHGEFGIDLMRAAQSRGVLVYVDAHWNPERLRSSALREALPYVDVFSPNLIEALEMTGAADAESALEMLREWCSCVAIKCGAQGCIAWCDDTYYSVPSIPIQAIETTGAGDNFNAGLIYGLLRGYSFETCLQCANIAGGLSTLVAGGYANDVTTAVVEGWLTRLTEGETVC